jgi:hypothetical protein
VTHQQTQAPQNVQAPQYDREGSGTRGSNGLAVAGFVLALLGALSSFIPLVNLFGDLVAFLGLILGVAGLATSLSKGAGRGLSIAAITFALSAFVISVIVNLAPAADVSTVPAGPGALVSADLSYPAEASGTAGVTSTCAAVSKALLTGTPAEINAGMLALVADTTADRAVREYAGYYTDRDKDRADMRKLEATLIQSSCS